MEKTADALTPYIGPGPPPKTGCGSLSPHSRALLIFFVRRDHRYTFLLYRETKEILPYAEQTTLRGNDRLGRRNFDLARFVQENGLSLVSAKCVPLPSQRMLADPEPTSYFISRNAEQ